MVWDSNTNVRRLTVRKGSLGFKINVPSSYKYMLIKTLFCILAHKRHFSCVSLSNGFKANFPLRIVIPRNDVHDISVLFIERTGRRCMIKNRRQLQLDCEARSNEKRGLYFDVFAGVYTVVSLKTDSKREAVFLNIGH